jgi:hypothetical protein
MTIHRIAILAFAASCLIAATSAHAAPYDSSRMSVRNDRVSRVLLNPQPLPPGPCKSCPGLKLKSQRYLTR